MLTERDLRAVLELAGEAHDAADLDDFRRSVLPALKRIVPSPVAAYNELDSEHRTIASFTDPPLPASAHEAWGRLAWQNPLIDYYGRTRDGRPFRWSDVVDVRAFRQTEVFRELYAPLEVDHQIAFALPSPPRYTIGIALGRPRTDYTDREREILQLVRPHLIQAYRHAELRESMRSLLDSARRGLDAAQLAVLVVDAEGVVIFLTARARELAAAAGADRIELGSPLPPPLRGTDPVATLRLDDGDTVLVRRTRGDREETAVVLARGSRALSLRALVELGLTEAEAKVLHALARGATTAEAASTLGVSPRTIHKHVERLNAKLGVRSRSQAIATAWAAAGT